MSIRIIKPYRFFLLSLMVLLFFGCKSKKDTTLLFVGSFTDNEQGEGIHVYGFNNETGESTLKFTLDSVTNTSFLKLSKNGKYLYAVMDSQMPYNGRIGAFAVDSIHGKIEWINTQDCGGLNPVHLALDKTGKLLANSNYSDGSLSLFKINKDGSLNSHSQVLKFKDSSIIKSRQEASHIHSSIFSPDNTFLFAQDLGGDKIRGFRLNVNSKDSILHNENQIKMIPGSGPRHFAFHPNGKFGYSIAELSGKITAFKYQNDDLVFFEDYLSYQKKQNIYRAADIHISADGQFLFASNRGPDEDSISIFLVNKDTGRLRLINHQSTYGKHPRNFAIDPSGQFLLVANQFTNNIVVFRHNPNTGKLIKLPKEIPVGQPSSLQMRTYTSK